jgi:hypothetical protein
MDLFLTFKMIQKMKVHVDRLQFQAGFWSKLTTSNYELHWGHTGI